jgi:predicted nucleic acid-binding protein
VVSAVVFLDSAPLGLVTNPNLSASSMACSEWLEDLLATGREVVIPEIADYEVRRELLRANKTQGIARLDQLASLNPLLRYLPITTVAMRKAAEFWAQARQQGQPTAGDNTIDADMILAAQAVCSNFGSVLIATTNVRHLARFAPAELWQNIQP